MTRTNPHNTKEKQRWENEEREKPTREEKTTGDKGIHTQ